MYQPCARSQSWSILDRDISPSSYQSPRGSIVLGDILKQATIPVMQRYELRDGVGCEEDLAYEHQVVVLAQLLEHASSGLDQHLTMSNDLDGPISYLT